MVGLGAWIVYIVDTVYGIYIYLYPAYTLGTVGLGAWIVYIVDDHYSVATCAAEDTPRALLAMLAYSGDLLQVTSHDRQPDRGPFAAGSGLS